MTAFRITNKRSAFTLIEVLVVVGIIALLVAILMPSLARAREQARMAACLSNLKQQGIGFSTYSADYKAVLPWVGSFRFSLMEGKYYLGWDAPDPTRHDWVRVNGGTLYPKYVGNQPDLFYCPNNKRADIDGDKGKKAFLQRHRHWDHTDPEYVDSHDFDPNAPHGAYGYAVPATEAKSPRDTGREMYPESVVRYGNVGESSEYPYWRYLNDPAEPDPSFLGEFPQASRGKQNIHALLSDGYFGGYEGYHLRGYNVLFGDFHAKRVVDPEGKIHAAELGPIRTWTYYGIEDAKVFMVWEYFSRNP